MPAMAEAKGYRRAATFEIGPRRPLTRREKDAAKARYEELRKTEPGFTPFFAIILSWLVDRVGYDGRCDPSHATIAEKTGTSVATVKRAIAKGRELGLISATMRVIRVAGRVLQRTSAYLFPPPRKAEISVAQTELEPRSLDSDSSLLGGAKPSIITLIEHPVGTMRVAQAALAARREQLEARMLRRGGAGR
jgi:Helix-turn-helix domain